MRPHSSRWQYARSGPHCLRAEHKAPELSHISFRHGAMRLRRKNRRATLRVQLLQLRKRTFLFRCLISNLHQGRGVFFCMFFDLYALFPANFAR